MYSLDVNFLKDRPEYRPPEQKDKPARQAAGAMTPLILGVAVGLLLPAMVGGLWLFLQNQIAQMEQEEQTLNAELARLKIGQQKLDQLNKDIAAERAETTALATVFNQIKPWSAMLADIRERVPPGVQIKRIEQKQQAVAAAAPAANTPASAAGAQPNNAQSVTPTLEIVGFARSFDDVNYFLLTLQRSPFFKNDETQLIKAELVRNPTRVEVKIPDNRAQSGTTKVDLPKVVDYRIKTSLSDVPASELIRELDRKGAVGLVTRIRTLQEKGVIQK
ncbi:MAG: PilN domain-containing protein [Cyanobacteriota bacterium]